MGSRDRIDLMNALFRIAKKTAENAKKRPLGQILLEMGAITQEQLDEALTKQRAIDATIEPRHIDEAPIVRVINVIVQEAIREKSTLITCRPTNRGLQVDFRIDDRDKVAMLVPMYIHPPLIHGLRKMSGCGQKKRYPQKGSIQFQKDGQTRVLKATFSKTEFGIKAELEIE